MANAIGRAGRTTVVIGLACALFVLLGSAGPVAAADTLSEFRLAQAATKPGAAPAPAAAPHDQEIERQIADLRKKLQITPAQQPQFDAFVQVMRQNAQSMAPLMQQQPHNALEQLRASAQAGEIEAAGLKRLVPVFEALYASLSDPQKRTADQLFAGPAQPNQPPGRGR